MISIRDEPDIVTADVPLVALHEVAVTYGSGSTEVHAVKDVSLDVRRGEMLLLMGPSGSGKTSLLQVIGMLLKPSRGQVALYGQPIVDLDERRMTGLRAAHFGFVFQAYNLLPMLTAVENVMIAFEFKGQRRFTAHRQAMTLLSRVGLAARADHHPAALSGGERQRVAVARALAGNPPIILADEPTAALDTEAGKRITELLRSLADDRAVVIVTHDHRIADYADRILMLEDGRLANPTSFSHG
jgi:putative ABC transport system ATP-binding protein